MLGFVGGFFVVFVCVCFCFALDAILLSKNTNRKKSKKKSQSTNARRAIAVRAPVLVIHSENLYYILGLILKRKKNE